MDNNTKKWTFGGGMKIRMETQQNEGARKLHQYYLRALCFPKPIY